MSKLKIKASVLPNIKTKIQGAVSRGIKGVYIDDNKHLVFILTDSTELDLGFIGTDIPQVPEIFYADYGETTYEECYQATLEGKVVILRCALSQAPMSLVSGTEEAPTVQYYAVGNLHLNESNYNDGTDSTIYNYFTFNSNIVDYDKSYCEFRLDSARGWTKRWNELVTVDTLTKNTLTITDYGNNDLKCDKTYQECTSAYYSGMLDATFLSANDTHCKLIAAKDNGDSFNLYFDDGTNRIVIKINSDDSVVYAS